MSWNNIIPAWTLGKYGDYYEMYQKGELTLVEFFELIRGLEEVPQGAKDVWKQKLERDSI